MFVEHTDNEVTDVGHSLVVWGSADRAGSTKSKVLLNQRQLVCSLVRVNVFGHETYLKHKKTKKMNLGNAGRYGLYLL